MLDYIHEGKAPLLSGSTGYIRYAIGGNAQGLFLRLKGRVASGLPNPGTWGRGNPICLHELLALLANAQARRQEEEQARGQEEEQARGQEEEQARGQEEQVEGYFVLEDLDTPEIHGRFDGKKDTNVKGFVTAVLIDIGFVQVLDSTRGRYCLRQGLR